MHASGTPHLLVAARVVLAFRRVDMHGVDRAPRAPAPFPAPRAILGFVLGQLGGDLRVSSGGALRSDVSAWHPSLPEKWIRRRWCSHRASLNGCARDSRRASRT